MKVLNYGIVIEKYDTFEFDTDELKYVRRELFPSYIRVVHWQKLDMGTWVTIEDYATETNLEDFYKKWKQE